jgi:hypothetical protein
MVASYLCRLRLCSNIYSQTITNKVFFDVEIDGGDKGRIVMGLFGEAVPKTVVRM